jgi:tetratricopeptide (TPR) repeat protein
MATAKITKKALSQDDFIEGVFDFGEWLEVHWKRVAIGLGAMVGLVLLGVAWSSMRDSAAEESNRLLALGIDAYAPAAAADGQTPAPRYTEALTLFEQAASSGASGRIGDVAQLFRARTLLSLGRPGEAVPVLEQLTTNANEGLAAEAKVSLAEAVEASGNPERAATLLQEVATPAGKASYPADAALLLLASLHERQGKKAEAKKAYDDLIAKFPQSPFAAEARQRVGQPTGTGR